MALKIQDLGILEGPVIVFGGPYSNAEATAELLRLARKDEIPADNLICTGDVVAIGASPEETVKLIRDAEIPVVAGNCEIQFGTKSEGCGCGYDAGSSCDLLSRAWFDYSDAVLSDASRDWMRDCPDRILFQHRGLRYVVIHGGARQVNRFIWPVTEEAELAEEMDALEQQVGRFDAVLAGHSGVPFIRDVNGRRWLNAGVLGKPAHDGTTESNYLVLDDLPVLKRLSYDFESAALAMEKVGLTQGYNDCLRTGYWPSESVLPPELRRRQHA